MLNPLQLSAMPGAAPATPAMLQLYSVSAAVASIHSTDRMPCVRNVIELRSGNTSRYPVSMNPVAIILGQRLVWFCRLGVSGGLLSRCRNHDAPLSENQHSPETGDRPW